MFFFTDFGIILLCWCFSEKSNAAETTKRELMSVGLPAD